MQELNNNRHLFMIRFTLVLNVEADFRYNESLEALFLLLITPRVFRMIAKGL